MRWWARGPGGRTSDLARCSIVGYQGDVVYDRYIRPAAPIVDYRTRWSGIRRQHMANAVPFGKAQREVRPRPSVSGGDTAWGWGGTRGRALFVSPSGPRLHPDLLLPAGSGAVPHP